MLDTSRIVCKTIVCFALLLLFAVPSFAGEYETTIEGFTFDGVSVPGYDGYSTEVVNGNDPLFNEADFGEVAEAHYGDLDELGRCTYADGLLDYSLIPTWTRGDIGSVKPSGWVQAQYPGVVSGGYLYNRCHLIGWQLTGADLTSMTKEELSKNLITGTRYLNVGSGGDGMVGYENEVATYIREDEDNKVAYSVIPVFFDNDLVARGVLMQAKSIGSDDISYCIFCYNVQPGIAIDYETGNSVLTQSLEDTTSINDCNVSLAADALTYTGTAVEPDVIVEHEGTKLSKEIDYVLTYKNNTAAGKASVIVTGVGDYRDSVSIEFTIEPASVKNCKVSLATTKIKCTGKALKPKVKVINGDRPLVEKTDYTVSYKNNKNTGKASVTVTGVGSCKDQLTKYFIITPAKAVINKTGAKKRSIKITVSAQKNVTGYEYAYKLKTKKKWTIKKAQKPTKIFKPLKRNKLYNVKVRAFKKIDGKIYRGPWSSVKKVKTKKR